MCTTCRFTERRKFYLRSRRKYFFASRTLKVYENATQMLLMLSLGFNDAWAVIKSILSFVVTIFAQCRSRNP